MNQSRPLLEAEAQRIKHAVDVPLRARSSLYSEPGRFVQDDDVVVPVDDQPLELRGIVVGDRRNLPRLGRRRGRDPGRQANGLAGLDAILALGALAVDPHLARAQKLLQRAMAQFRIMPLEPAVQPEPGFLVGDGAQFHPPAHVRGFTVSSTGCTPRDIKFVSRNFRYPASAPPEPDSPASAPPAVRGPARRRRRRGAAQYRPPSAE